MSPPAGFFSRVYRVVRKIPPGRVATYGQVALLVGNPGAARAVGWALRGLDDETADTVPWHRVVNAAGGISPRPGISPELQRRRLRAEGVRFKRGRVDLARHGTHLQLRPGAAGRRARSSAGPSTRRRQ